MITTIQEIIKNQGWQQGQLVETDIWMGIRYIRHINRVMLIEGGTLHIEYDKEIYACDKPEVSTHETEVSSLDYSKDNELVKAHTQTEALADAKMMANIIKEKEQMRVEKIKSAMLKGIKIIQDGMGEYCDNRTAVEQLDKFQGKEFEKFRRLFNNAGYYKSQDDIDEDVVYEVRRIFRQHGFMFQDEDNECIQTWVNLDKALSVETDCQYDSKDCVHIVMSEDKAFNVYKDTDKDLYLALETLYSNN